jgi:RHS repeat-associated protein
VGTYDYLPFGEEIPSSYGRGSVSCYGQTDATMKFGGYERDAETGLENSLARHMAGPQGRFLSVDPDNVGADPTYPQTWNAYAYVGNSPLVNTDPDGMFCPATGCTGDENGDQTAAADAAQALWDLWRLSQQQTWNWFSQGVQQLGQELLNNLSKPRNANCVAGFAAGGTAVGGTVGLLGLAGGPAVGLTGPGGLAVGSAAGAGLGVLFCSSTTGSRSSGSSEGASGGDPNQDWSKVIRGTRQASVPRVGRLLTRPEPMKMR